MISQKFFARSTERVARDLIGNYIITEDKKVRIVETEAYLENDPASHAYPRKTDRNRLMYETYGKIYVYICYGIHNMLNFTTEKEGVGGVLIRSAEPVEGVQKMKKNRDIEDEKLLCNGPGKLSEAFGISRELNGSEVGETIHVEEGDDGKIEKSTRIGISKAKDNKLRFYESDNTYVSRQ